MELIDTHCHLDITEFQGRFATLLAQARSAGVGRLVLPGVDQSGWNRLLELCREENGLYPAPGLHPLYLPRHRPAHLTELGELAQREKLVALGEIGLDYFATGVNRAAQQELFEEQLRIATSARLPVLLHVRKAHDQVLATLRRKHFRNGGIVHAYGGSRQQADQYLGLGFCLGLCGTITYSRARKIRAIAADFPAEGLVLETDAPDIPPAAHRGEENLPEYLPEVLNALAELRQQSAENLAALTSANACRVLSLPS